jgi:fatty-acyl-CoA synthase
VISDRKKDVIITGGENVSSIEVEDCLFAPGGRRGRGDRRAQTTSGARRCKAFVVLRPGFSPTPAELIAHCRSLLSHFKCPTGVELRDALPRTATGKLQKFRLREPFWAGRERKIS